MIFSLSPRHANRLTREQLLYLQTIYDHFPGETYALEGTNLIELLGDYQMPPLGRMTIRRDFTRSRSLFGGCCISQTQGLEVTRTDSTIIISDDGLRLPLASYGTGVQQLLILVTAALSVDNAILCIEEPEIHLHPRMLRELVQFLVEHINNQYVISTHSPTLINCADADIQVFHLLPRDGATVGAPVLENSEGLRAIRDLGLKASDLLQTDCIIWVEGPSDRIYLQRWIELVAPDLMEGRDYVFMYYSGLPILSVQDGCISGELVNVLQL